MAPKVAPCLFSSFIFLLLIGLSLQSHAEVLEPNTKKSSSRNVLLTDLQGARKGVNLQGLHQLKKYLHQFGYLNSLAKDDDFDETLEVALKTYQKNYHLKPTGSLDMETIAQMIKPRCGVPDIINGTTRMHGIKNTHNHSPKSFFMDSNYELQGSKWPQMPVTYRFVTDISSDFQTAIKSAMSSWEAATNGHLSFEEVPSGEFISIGFFSGDHGDNVPFDGLGNGVSDVLAHGFYPNSGGALHFDAAENWSTVDPSPPGTVDVESVALHELGHTLGLRHSNVPGAIMGAYYSGARTTKLGSDDIEGIQALYGS